MSEQNVETRVLTLEMESRVAQSDLSSLRASRHEQGNWLNRHDLELQALKIALNEHHKGRIDMIDSEIKTIMAEQESIRAMIAGLSSDIKTERWKVGAVIAVLVFVAQQLATRIQF